MNMIGKATNMQKMRNNQKIKWQIKTLFLIQEGIMSQIKIIPSLQEVKELCMKTYILKLTNGHPKTIINLYQIRGNSKVKMPILLVIFKHIMISYVKFVSLT